MAGSRGMHVVGMNSATDNLRACWDAYQAGAKSLNQTLRPCEGVGMCVVIYVAETMEEAARDIRPSINHYYEFVSGARPGGEWDRRSFLNKGETLSGDAQNSDWFDFLQSREIIWVGTPEYVVEKMHKYREEVGLEHIMLLQQFPGVPIEKILASMERFGEHIIPQFPNAASLDTLNTALR